MNRTIVALIAFGLPAVAASASSIVSIAPPAPGAPTSILVPAPLPGPRVEISHSMLALGNPEPTVSDEQVASTNSGPADLPIMIRGGLVTNGGASIAVPISQPASSGGGASAANPTGGKAIAKIQARKAARNARREAADNPQPMAKDNTPPPPTAKPQ